MTGHEFGDYIRSRREALTPEQVGLAGGDSRRVPGLRREELALLSGVSVDYVKRIEQGHERSPSPQVVEALARALRLDRHGLTYLSRLAGQRDPAAGDDEPVRAGLWELLDGLGAIPALVVDPAMTVLAANPIAEALFSGFVRADNILSMIFLDPHATDFYADWEGAAAGAVGNLRANVAEYPDDPRIAAVIGTLMVRSPAFADRWSRHEVRPRTLDDKLFRHPRVGELHLRFQTFTVDEAPGQRLYLYGPARGSGAGARLAMLAELTERADATPTAEGRGAEDARTTERTRND